MCKQLVLLACAFLVPLTAWGQEPLPPLPDDAPPVQPAPPSTFGAPNDAQGAPLDEEMARRVARDAYLGGMGVLGPIPSFVGAVGWLAPVMGGVASAWALEQAEPARGGRWMESMLAAVTASLVREFGSRAFGALLTPLIFALEIPPVLAVGAGVLATGALLSSGNVPVNTVMGVYLGAVGGALVLLAPALLVVTLFVPLTTMFTRWLAIALADVVYERLTLRKSQPRSTDVLGARIPQERPMDTLLTAGLVAASVSGRWERSAYFEHIPLVGPWLAMGDARTAVSSRMGEARQVAGWSKGPDMGLVVDALLFSRAAVLTLGMGLFLALPAALVGVGAATFAVGALALLGPSLPVLLTALIALGIAYTGLAVVVVAAGALGTVALLGAGILQDLIPWMLGAVAVWGERPLLSSEVAP